MNEKTESSSLLGVLNKILGIHWLVLMVFGILLLLVSAPNSIPLGGKDVTIDYPWRVGISILSIILLIAAFVLLVLQIRENKLSGKSPTPKADEQKPNAESESLIKVSNKHLKGLVDSGCTNAFRIPIENHLRLERVGQIIAEEARGNKKIRLMASSGYSYIVANGPVWDSAGLGKLIETGAITLEAVLESPFSDFATTRALANGKNVSHWQDKISLDAIVNALQYPNVSIWVTELPVNCSLFFTSKEVFYDPYLWARRIGRTENNFWVLEFSKISNAELDCYELLEKHYQFVKESSIPLEEFLTPPIKPGGKILRGPHFYDAYRKNTAPYLRYFTERSNRFSARLKERNGKENTK